MNSVFESTEYIAPYLDLFFPGKAEDEKILYVTRESPMMLLFRLTSFMLIATVTMIVGVLIVGSIGGIVKVSTELVVLAMFILFGVVLFGGLWWVNQVYRRTVFIITNRRLTKFIYTTPWTRYQMSLTLDKVVDSASYNKGYLQAVFGLGTFVARSSAGNIKNFKIENIHMAEDLHNWMNKLMFTFGNELSKLDEFRPFVPKASGKRY